MLYAATLFAYRPGTLIGIAAIIAWIICWVVGAIDIFTRRPDLGVVGKIVWLLVIILFPIFGLLVYYLGSAFAGTSQR